MPTRCVKVQPWNGGAEVFICTETSLHSDAQVFYVAEQDIIEVATLKEHAESIRSLEGRIKDLEDRLIAAKLVEPPGNL